MRLLLGLWSAIVLVNYAFTPAHVPDSAHLSGLVAPVTGEPSLRAWSDFIVSRAGAARIWFVANVAILGGGYVAMRWIATPVTVIRAWLMGIAPIALALLGLGLCGLWNKPAMLVIITGAAIAPILRLPSAGESWRSALCFPRCAPKLDRATLLMTAIAAAPCLLALPGALAPETAFDALRYHLGLPDVYLDARKVFHVDRFLFSGFPATMEMLYGLALRFGTTVSAQLFAWQFFVVSTVQIFLFLRNRIPVATAVFLCAAFSSMPFLSSHACFAGVDHPIMCLELAAFIAIHNGLTNAGRRNEWAVAGWLLGTGMGMKYLGSFAVVAAGFALLATGIRSPGTRRFAGFTLPVAAVVVVAWGAKNWLLTGNPVYPYLFGHFQIEPETYRLHLLWAEEWKSAYSWLTGWIKLVPVSLSRGIYDSHGEALAPYLFMLFGLVTASGGPLVRTERWLLLTTAFIYVVWSHSGGGIYRYLAPLYPAATLLAGVLVARVPGVSLRMVNVFLVVSIVVQVPPLISALHAQTGGVDLFVGAESDRGHIGRFISPHRRYLPAMERAATTAGNGRLYVLGDPKTYYAKGRRITEFEMAPPLLHSIARTCATPARMRIALRQRGVTAILYRIEGTISVGVMSGSSLSGPALKRFQDFWRSFASPEWAAEYLAENCFYHCYTLSPKPGPFRPPDSALWYMLPTMEAPTQPIDAMLDAGRFNRALEQAQALIRHSPDFAPGWLRLWLAADKIGENGAKSRAAAALRRLGFAALLAEGV